MKTRLFWGNSWCCFQEETEIGKILAEANDDRVLFKGMVRAENNDEEDRWARRIADIN
jgi:hypothetical protein